VVKIHCKKLESELDYVALYKLCIVHVKVRPTAVHVDTFKYQLSELVWFTVLDSVSNYILLVWGAVV